MLSGEDASDLTRYIRGRSVEDVVYVAWSMACVIMVRKEDRRLN
jgi:hypothetical protein